jgi:integrase
MAWVEEHGDGFRVRYRLDDTTIHTEYGYASQHEADDRATDVESDQRRHRFADPRLARTSVEGWIRAWCDAHHVADITQATYDSHIRNHILPRWSDTALGDIKRIAVKVWVNKMLRANLADRSAQDVLVLFSMIIGEAVDEGIIASNPCRRLRISFGEPPERPHAATDEVDALAGRMTPDNGLMTITAAYTGLRWGELAGLQWSRTYLGEDPRIHVDPSFGALHEIRGRLEPGPPKSPASVRVVHLPPFLAENCARTVAATPAASLCSPAPSVDCIADPTSVVGPGSPPWPGTNRGVGHPSIKTCTSMIYATRTKPG